VNVHLSFYLVLVIKAQLEQLVSFLRGKEAESMKGIALPASTFNDKRSLGTQQANVVLF